MKNKQASYKLLQFKCKYDINVYELNANLTESLIYSGVIFVMFELEYHDILGFFFLSFVVWFLH